MEETTVQVGKTYLARIDVRDLPFVSAFNWSPFRVRGHLYARTRVGGKQTLMHQLILRAWGFRTKGDHRNGDGLDNTRENLRPCTHKQNMWNRRKPKGRSSSRFKGVSREPAAQNEKVWRATIQANGRKMHLGLFANEADAAVAYDDAALRFFGEFALTNFPHRLEDSCTISRTNQI